MKEFSPSQVATELAILSKAGAVIVGGQAVNIWCGIYGDDRMSPWAENRPFTSRDADGFAATRQMLDGARALENSGYSVEVFFPETDAEGRLNTGALRVTGPDHCLEINFLREIRAVPAREIESAAVTVPVAGQPIRVMHPLHCLESKTISLLELDQSERNDKRHLMLLLACVRSMLGTLASQNPAAALLIARQLVQDALTDVAVDLLRIHQLRLLDAVPWARFRGAGSRELAEFSRQEEAVTKQFDSYVAAAEELEAIRRNPHGSAPDH